jgi:integrase
VKAFVFQHRTREGKSPFYSARIQMPGWLKPRDIRLQVTQKRVAQEKLRDLVKEFELEAVGLAPAVSIRAAAKTPLADHLAAYLEAVAASGKSKNTVGAYKRGISTFLARSKWSTLADVGPAGFDRWRIEHEPSSKYANDVLGFLRTWFGWMVRRKLLAFDPLADVSKAKVRNDGCKRAAFTPAQLDALCAAVPPVRAFAYRFSAYTGIRRGEMNSLRWSDFDLDAFPPSVVVRASISKNARTERLPLQSDVLALLRAMQPDLCQPFEWVFRNRVPNMDTFHRDRKRAGIPDADDQGAKYDFHALRTTFITMLNAAGVAPRVAMSLARHSDMKLTMKVYTNTNGLPLAAGVAALPSFSMPIFAALPGETVVSTTQEKAPETATPQTTPAGVVSGQNGAFPVVSSRRLAKKAKSVNVAPRPIKGPPDISGDPSKMVDPSRFELLTSSMPLRRSTN